MTARQGFEAGDLPAALLTALGRAAAQYGATLRFVTDGGSKAALSAVVDAAEGLLRLDAAGPRKWSAGPQRREAVGRTVCRRPPIRPSPT